MLLISTKESDAVRLPMGYLDDKQSEDCREYSLRLPPEPEERSKINWGDFSLKFILDLFVRTMITQQQWKTLLENLRQGDNDSTACKRAGIDHATYYRKLKKSRTFKQQADEATLEGKQLYLDYTHNKHKENINKGDGASIRFELARRHPDYMTQPKVAPQFDTDTAENMAPTKGATILAEEVKHLLGEKVPAGEIGANWQAIAIRVHNRRKSRSLEPEGVADAMRADLILQKALEEQGNNGKEVYERYPIEATDGHDLYHLTQRALAALRVKRELIDANL